ncbi:MAG: DUF3135 domain-containing protein [Motiliproteus sp.]
MAELPEFETLIELADKDPEAFERFRQQTCQQFIETTSNHHQHRLRAIQNRVEMALDRAANPMAGIISVSTMMHDSFYQLTCKLQQVNRLTRHKKNLTPLPTSPSATIIDIDDWKAQAEARGKTRH